MRESIWEKNKDSRDIQGHRECLEDPALSQAPEFILVSGALEKKHKSQVRFPGKLRGVRRLKAGEPGTEKCIAQSPWKAQLL